MPFSDHREELEVLDAFSEDSEIRDDSERVFAEFEKALNEAFDQKETPQNAQKVTFKPAISPKACGAKESQVTQ